jgi:hypothetical protein
MQHLKSVGNVIVNDLIAGEGFRGVLPVVGISFGGSGWSL